MRGHGLHSVMGGEFGPSHACSNNDVGKSERQTLETDPKLYNLTRNTNAMHNTKQITDCSGRVSPTQDVRYIWVRHFR